MASVSKKKMLSWECMKNTGWDGVPIYRDISLNGFNTVNVIKNVVTVDRRGKPVRNPRAQKTKPKHRERIVNLCHLIAIDDLLNGETMHISSIHSLRDVILYSRYHFSRADKIFPLSHSWLNQRIVIGLVCEIRLLHFTVPKYAEKIFETECSLKIIVHVICSLKYGHIVK